MKLRSKLVTAGTYLALFGSLATADSPGTGVNASQWEAAPDKSAAWIRHVSIGDKKFEAAIVIPGAAQTRDLATDWFANMERTLNQTTGSQVYVKESDWGSTTHSFYWSDARRVVSLTYLNAAEPGAKTAFVLSLTPRWAAASSLPQIQEIERRALKLPKAWMGTLNSAYASLKLELKETEPWWNRLQGHLTHISPDDLKLVAEKLDLLGQLRRTDATLVDRGLILGSEGSNHFQTERVKGSIQDQIVEGVTESVISSVVPFGGFIMRLGNFLGRERRTPVAESVLKIMTDATKRFAALKYALHEEASIMAALANMKDTELSDLPRLLSFAERTKVLLTKEEKKKQEDMNGFGDLIQKRDTSEQQCVPISTLNAQLDQLALQTQWLQDSFSNGNLTKNRCEILKDLLNRYQADYRDHRRVLTQIRAMAEEFSRAVSQNSRTTNREELKNISTLVSRHGSRELKEQFKKVERNCREAEGKIKHFSSSSCPTRARKKDEDWRFIDSVSPPVPSCERGHHWATRRPYVRWFKCTDPDRPGQYLLESDARARVALACMRVFPLSREGQALLEKHKQEVAQFNLLRRSNNSVPSVSWQTSCSALNIEENDELSEELGKIREEIEKAAQKLEQEKDTSRPDAEFPPIYYRLKEVIKECEA